MLYRAIVVLVLLVALAFAFGCAPGVERTVDPSSGNFFTEEEYQKLSGDQREAYCAQLLSAYNSGQDCVSEARDGLDREGTAIADLEAELEGLQPRLMSIKGEVESLQSEIAYFEGLPRVYTVVKGDFLYVTLDRDTDGQTLTLTAGKDQALTDDTLALGYYNATSGKLVRRNNGVTGLDSGRSSTQGRHWRPTIPLKVPTPT